MDEYEDNSLQEQDLRMLKAILSNQRIALDFSTHYSSSLFLGDAKHLAEAILSYVKIYKDLPTKRVLSDKYPAIKNQIDNLYQELTNVEFEPQEFKYDLEKFIQRYKDTRTASLADELRFNSNVNADTIIKEMERTIKDVRSISGPTKQAYTQKGIHEFIDDFTKEYVAKIEAPELGAGIKTGYSFLDYVTNGLAPAEMLIVGAETGGGKSMFLNNIAIQMWMQENTIASSPFSKGYNVQYFSLEMPYKACFRRTLARLADVPMYGLRDSNLTKAELESVYQASAFIKKYSEQNQFEIVDIPRGVTVEQIEERYLEACTRYQPDIVVVDYLGLLEDHDIEGDDWLKLGKIAGKLHEFARAYNIRLLTAVQLNRPAKSKNTDPAELIGIHRIGRSSQILHHANIGIQLETRKDEHLRDTLVYHVIKNRDGECGKAEISKKFKNGSIFDVPYRVPNKDDFGSYISGFDDEEDISSQIKNILRLK